MAAMNIVEHVSLLNVEESYGYMPRSSITGLSGSTMSSFLRNLQTDFQIGVPACNTTKWRSVPLSQLPHQYLLSPVFDLNHSDMCMVESQENLNFHLTDD